MNDFLIPKQFWLLAYENPLRKRFDSDFFKQIPQSPGIYWMLGSGQSILYVGKAKNLKKRIGSYKQVKPNQSSRKTLRLIHLVTQICWEECESEEAAFLRENHLLRTHKPPFNVLNTHPETYFFIGFRSTQRKMQFRLTTSPQTLGDQLFGTFKGRGLVQRGYAALLRLLWSTLTEYEAVRFEFPGVLVRRQIPTSYSILFKEGMTDEEKKDWSLKVRKFFQGASDDLLGDITQKLLTRENIPPFMYSYIQQDLEVLAQLFKYGPYRNLRLRKFHGLRKHLVAQEKIDDLLVTYCKKSR